MARAEISVKVLDLPEVKAYIAEVNAQAERMRAVVEAAQAWRDSGLADPDFYYAGADAALDLIEAVDSFRSGARP